MAKTNKMTDSSIRVAIKLWTQLYIEENSDYGYAKGHIVALRSVLGEDSLEVLSELNALKKSALVDSPAL